MGVYFLLNYFFPASKRIFSDTAAYTLVCTVRVSAVRTYILAKVKLTRTFTGIDREIRSESL